MKIFMVFTEKSELSFYLIVLCSNASDVIIGVAKQPGPNCSKLTMSLVNDSLKFTSSDTQIC